MPIKKLPAAKKRATKKRTTSSAPGAALKKYSLAMKRGTATISKKILDYERKIVVLKKLKKAKIKVLTKKYKK